MFRKFQPTKERGKEGRKEEGRKKGRTEKKEEGNKRRKKGEGRILLLSPRFMPLLFVLPWYSCHVLRFIHF